MVNEKKDPSGVSTEAFTHEPCHHPQIVCEFFSFLNLFVVYYGKLFFCLFLHVQDVYGEQANTYPDKFFC